RCAGLLAGVGGGTAAGASPMVGRRALRPRGRLKPRWADEPAGAVAVTGRRRRGIGEAGWGWTLFAGAISFVYFFPVLWIVLTAFKTHNDALAIPPKWFFTPTLENFVQVFSRAYSADAAAV